MGYVADPVSPLLVIEYCQRGDLLHFVKERKSQLVHVSLRGRQEIWFSFLFQGTESQENLKVKNLVSFAWQISNGLVSFKCEFIRMFIIPGIPEQHWVYSQRCCG
jgi:hypothetical protein